MKTTSCHSLRMHYKPPILIVHNRSNDSQLAGELYPLNFSPLKILSHKDVHAFKANSGENDAGHILTILRSGQNSGMPADTQADLLPH